MKVSIIILNYNTKDLTLKCVHSVINQYRKEIENKEFEIIVVDNASSDESVKLLKKIKQIILVQNHKNYGFSKGCNIGAKYTRGRYIFFLNSDATVEDQGLLKMIDFLDHNEDVGILGGRLIGTNGKQQAHCGTFYSVFNLPFIFSEWLIFRPSKVQKVDWVSGGSMMIRRKLFEDLKGFDEKLFMYMEDMELCYRAKKKKFHTYFFPYIKIIHKELGSSNNRSFAINQIYKGIMYFFRKHKPYWQYLFIKFALAFKAILIVIIGIFSNNNYFKRTYTSALKLTIGTDRL